MVLEISLSELQYVSDVIIHSFILFSSLSSHIMSCHFFMTSKLFLFILLFIKYKGWFLREWINLLEKKKELCICYIYINNTCTYMYLHVLQTKLKDTNLLLYMNYCALFRNSLWIGAVYFLVIFTLILELLLWAIWPFWA